ncbi:galanin peptides isoform X1 [Myotis daubentonii]|uniref:galanin peptides isoform X1 n=1 Tax=Myotis daubentonii TaxID=98922 RepID=UPI0028738E56|nr:galanin peptides isoform X1 [Myotis daubentonii]
MPRGRALLLAALLLAALSATLGSPVKEKRGWTLNSAGYLLGPNAVDNHRSFHDKHGLAGKRDLQPEDGARAGDSDRLLPWNDDVVRKIMEFLTFLHLKEAGALVPMLPSAASWEDTEQSALREPGKALPSQEVRF